MSHQSSQRLEITAENASQLPCSAGRAWAREKRFADVPGRRMAYIETRPGTPTPATLTFIDEMAGTEPLTLGLHDWGGALGFDWAHRHQQRVRAIAHMETFVASLTRRICYKASIRR